MASHTPTGDTIVALGTPRGYSGIGVIRLSGPDTLTIIETVFLPSGERDEFPDRRAVYGRVIDPETGRTLDDGVAVFMKGPATYTGDDTAEISLHGSPVVLDTVIRFIVKAGARPAGRGEFTRRAFLSGRLDLAQAEAVIDLIEAPTPEAAFEARARVDASVSREVRNVSDLLKDLLAELEAHLDFDEDELEPEPDPLPQLRRALETIRELIARAEAGRIVREGLQTVIVGKPNVGKSTLFNALLRSDRAIAHPTPGTTRDTVEERLALAGRLFVLCDTAGIRTDPEPVEDEGIRRALAKAETADLAIAVVDGSQALDDDDRRVMDVVRDLPTVIALNKADLGIRVTDRDLDRAGVRSRAVRVSARTGPGMDELERVLVDLGDAALAGGAVRDRGALNRRCRELAEAAVGRIERLVERLERGEPVPAEIVSLEVRDAVGCFGEITGERAEEGVLERIFERFCVGK